MSYYIKLGEKNKILIHHKLKLLLIDNLFQVFICIRTNSLICKLNQLYYI